MSVVDTTALLTSDSTRTSPSHPQYQDAAILGWLIELLQAFFLVSDDIMDNSITRRGSECWYRQTCENQKVGMIAINDAFMLESSIYVVLKQRFRQHPRYIDMVELFQDISFRTEMGQQCDLLTAPEDNVDLTRFTMEKYWFIVRYKTSYYSFFLPVALALLYLDKGTENNLRQAKEVLVAMGEYFQVQDDYLDCFANAEFLGKVGTDIKDNKCSWLVCQALQIANKDQRRLLEQNYGRKDDKCEEQVKKLYDDLGLQSVYERYEEDAVGRIRALVDKVDESEGLKRGVFEEFLRKIYKRSK